MLIKTTVFYDEFCQMKGCSMTALPDVDALQRAE
jgi:hypothetical protein